MSVGDALDALALEMNRDTAWRRSMDPAFDPAATGAERREQIAALRRHLQDLHTRITDVLERAEGHTRTLAMEELARRQQLLEALQERASLELAKTYDHLSRE
jgi:hypothetical protein